VNLLREGLDLPEVSLVAILDADKEGFLRNARSLIQTSGRAARNVNGMVILYAEKMTDAILRTIEETNRRRRIQKEYNREHGITPESVKKSIDEILNSTIVADREGRVQKIDRDEINILDLMDSQEALANLKKQMKAAADKLEFEEAAKLRDEILKIESGMGNKPKSKG
jgi:excinuclease ABC subunit B